MIKIYTDIVPNPTLPEMFPNFCCAVCYDKWLYEWIMTHLLKQFIKKK